MHIGHSHDTSALVESWDFENHGGLFDLGRAKEARAFFQRWGFVVMTDVMTEDENKGVLQGLVEDVHEINPNTRHIQDVAGFTEAHLPSSPNHSFRTTCNLVFGRFASLIRSNEGVRSSFGVMHGVPPERLGCSWDTIFYTSEAAKVTDNLATQLHWDHNGWCGGERMELAEHLCVQGVYYASATSKATPSFACCPASHEMWQKFSESAANPSKAGDKLLNYMPLTAYSEEFIEEVTLPLPVRIHAPARSLLLWNSRTCHGNSPATDHESSTRPSLGRVSLAISYGPVDQRTVEVQKDSLVKALGGVRTTHHPAVMLSHNKQGYPSDWTAEAEHEPKHVQHGGELHDLEIQLNLAVSEAEFQQMIQRSSLDDQSKLALATTVNLDNVRLQTYQSYWGIAGLVEEDCYGPMLQLHIKDLRRLINPQYSQVQGLHHTERHMEEGE